MRATQLDSLWVKGRILTAVKTLREEDIGKTIFLNSATEFAVTLPEARIGMSLQFIVKAAPAGANYTIVTRDSDNIIKGQVYTTDVNAGADPDFETSGGDTITLVASKSVAGDRVDLISDGTYWYVSAFCSVYDAITITTAS
jgi:hypothetical protein